MHPSSATGRPTSFGPNDTCTHRTRGAPALLTAAPDTHEPHTLVQSVSSRCPEPPGSCAEPKYIARTVLRRAQQCTLSSAQAAASRRGSRSAPSRGSPRDSRRGASLRYLQCCAAHKPAAVSTAESATTSGQNFQAFSRTQGLAREGRNGTARWASQFERSVSRTITGRL